VQLAINQEYTCENLKLLEVVMEHLLFHWEDIVDVLLDELLAEEVNERNQIEAKLQGQHQQPNTEGGEEEEAPEERHQRVLDRKREVDLREIMRIFDDYKRIEESVANRLN
jgi:hypothetical protein